MSRRKVVLAFAHRTESGIEIVRDLSLHYIEVRSRYHTRYRCTRGGWVVYVFIHNSMNASLTDVKRIAAFVVDCPDKFEEVPIFPPGF